MDSLPADPSQAKDVGTSRKVRKRARSSVEANRSTVMTSGDHIADHCGSESLSASLLANLFGWHVVSATPSSRQQSIKITLQSLYSADTQVNLRVLRPSQQDRLDAAALVVQEGVETHLVLVDGVAVPLPQAATMLAHKTLERALASSSSVVSATRQNARAGEERKEVDKLGGEGTAKEAEVVQLVKPALARLRREPRKSYTAAREGGQSAHHRDEVGREKKKGKKEHEGEGIHNESGSSNDDEDEENLTVAMLYNLFHDSTSSSPTSTAPSDAAETFDNERKSSAGSRATVVISSSSVNDASGEGQNNPASTTHAAARVTPPISVIPATKTMDLKAVSATGTRATAKQTVSLLPLRSIDATLMRLAESLEGDTWSVDGAVREKRETQRPLQLPTLLSPTAYLTGVRVLSTHLASALRSSPSLLPPPSSLRTEELSARQGDTLSSPSYYLHALATHRHAHSDAARAEMRRGLEMAVGSGCLRGDTLFAGVHALQVFHGQQHCYKYGTVASAGPECLDRFHHSSESSAPVRFPREMPRAFLPVSGRALLDAQLRVASTLYWDTSSNSARQEGDVNNHGSNVDGAHHRSYRIYEDGVPDAPRLEIKNAYELRGSFKLIPRPQVTTPGTLNKEEDPQQGVQQQQPSLPFILASNPTADMHFHIYRRFLPPTMRMALEGEDTTFIADSQATPDGSGHRKDRSKPRVEVGTEGARVSSPASVKNEGTEEPVLSIDEVIRTNHTIQPVPMPDVEWKYGTC